MQEKTANTDCYKIRLAVCKTDGVRHVGNLAVNLQKPSADFADWRSTFFGVCIERITSIGNNKHIRLLFSKGETSFQAVRFSVSEEEFEYNVGDVVDIAVTLDINLYNSKEYLSIVIKDMRLSGTDASKNLESTFAVS